MHNIPSYSYLFSIVQSIKVDRSCTNSKHYAYTINFTSNIGKSIFILKKMWAVIGKEMSPFWSVEFTWNKRLPENLHIGSSKSFHASCKYRSTRAWKTPYEYALHMLGRYRWIANTVDIRSTSRHFVTMIIILLTGCNTRSVSINYVIWNIPKEKEKHLRPIV